jgi:hypothetical protein
MWKNFIKFDERFFEKTDSGKYIFFPWGLSGDSYYIQENQISRLNTLSYVKFPAAVLILGSVFLFQELSVKGQYTNNWITSLAVSICLGFHLITTHLMVKDLEPAPLSGVGSHRQNGLAGTLLALCIFQALLIVTNVTHNASRVPMLILGSVSILLYLAIFAVLRIRKGYLFYKQPNSHQGF